MCGIAKETISVHASDTTNRDIKPARIAITERMS
jgi:hypothetical protein